MKKILFLSIFIFLGGIVFAQDLPSNPESGCYVKCKTPDVWKIVEESVEVHAAYKEIVTHPAEYKTITEKVLLEDKSEKLEIIPAEYGTVEVIVVVKEASHRLEHVPAEFGTKTVTYTAKDDASKLTVVPATFGADSKTIKIKPTTNYWKWEINAKYCDSDDPNDCMIWCYAEVPADYVTIPLTPLNVDAHTTKEDVPGFQKEYTYTIMTKAPSTKKIDIPEVTKVITKTVMTKAPTTNVVNIPAKYVTITKVVLVKDAWEEEVTVPAVFKTVEKEVLVEKGGLTVWKEVECELTAYNLLYINWKLNSATLTKDAKNIIDNRLLPVLKEGMTLELSSHTDARGSKVFNQDLSDRRAASVKAYLISKGINSSLLMTRGLGETMLKNKCADGVQCTEEEHLVNRRTEFRIIDTKN